MTVSGTTEYTTRLLNDQKLHTWSGRLTRAHQPPFGSMDSVRWCYAHFRRSLPLPVLVDGPSGSWLFPLRIDTEPGAGTIARWYGHGLIDEMDCMSLSNDLPLDPRIVTCLVRAVAVYSGARVLDFAGLGPENQLLHAATAFGGTRGRYLLSAHDLCLRICLVGRGSSALRFGRTLEKKLRRCARGGVQLIYPEVGSVERNNAVTALIANHRVRWQASNETKDLDLLYDFVRYLAVAHEVALPTLITAGGDILAVLLIVESGAWGQFYLQAFAGEHSRVSPSRVATALYLQELHGRRPQVLGLDFMRGDENYKEAFCDERYPLRRLTLWLDDASEADAEQAHQSFV